MEPTPPEWVLIEAAKRSNYTGRHTPADLRRDYRNDAYSFRALCDTIQKYEQPPVDPAVELLVKVLDHMGCRKWATDIRNGYHQGAGSIIRDALDAAREEGRAERKKIEPVLAYQIANIDRAIRYEGRALTDILQSNRLVVVRQEDLG